MKIKQIFEECGRPDFWLNPPHNINIAAFVKRNLIDQFFQTWNSSLEKSSKGRNYSLFKDNPNFESYWLKLPKQMYIDFAKFQTSNHRFPCEIGRFQNIELSDRKCTLCDKNDVGDEMHYLLICPYFNVDRTKFISKYHYTRPNIIKFKQLMCTQNLTKLKKLCHFIRILLQTVK